MPHRRSISMGGREQANLLPRPQRYRKASLFFGGGASGACGGSGAVAVVSLFPPAARSEDLNLKDTK